MAQNSTTAENLTRSANEPTIKVQVIAAKVAWNAAKVKSGMYTPLLKVAATESGVIPLKKSLSNDPINGLPAVKAREYP